jgi:Ca2+-binding RTX toxin-like protein
MFDIYALAPFADHHTLGVRSATADSAPREHADSPSAPLNLNILIEGQSNAQMLYASGAAAQIQALVQKLLGFNGTTQTITLLGGSNVSAWGGTPLLPEPGGSPTSWLNGNQYSGWTSGTYETNLDTYLKSLSAAERADPTAIVWLHNESDSVDQTVTESAWQSAVQYAINDQRQALGTTAANSHVFFATIPYDFGPGWIENYGSMAIPQDMKIAYANLAANSAFNASIGAQIGDVNMDGSDPYIGGQHLDTVDQSELVVRLADSIAKQFVAYAQPGSVIATAGANFDSTGPQAVAAQVFSTNQLLVTVNIPGGGGSLQPLSSAAAQGAGWQIVQPNGTIVYADGARIIDGRLLLTFNGSIPVSGGGSLYYGYGPGRIYVETSKPALGAPEGAGQGAAIYDSTGLPIWASPTGVALSVPSPNYIDLGIAPSTISGGGNYDDVAVGSGSLVFLGGYGASTICGGAGAVLATGGFGRLDAYGNSGADLFFGGTSGGDILVAGSGNSILVGSESDVLVGNTGSSTIYCGGGQNTVFGASGDGLAVIVQAAGNDLVVGGGGSELVFGGTGHDTVFGGNSSHGSMTFVGSAVGSVFAAGSQAVTAYAGSGNDTLISGSGGGNYHLGAGNTAMWLYDPSAPCQNVTFGSGQSSVFDNSPTMFFVVNGAGSGMQTIGNFTIGVDHLHLENFGGQLPEETTTNAGTVLKFSDGMQIDLVGVTHPTLAIFG